MKKSFLSAFLILFIPLFMNGQSTFPNIVPSTPEASALAKYGEYPVDYSTGVPKIEIPLYTIRSGELELPISISYHASGIKANDIATTIGLGWVLNANGVIARTILGGRDDIQNKRYKSSADITAAIQSATTDMKKKDLAYTLDSHIKNYIDTQSDRYSYNFSRHFGVFRSNFLEDEGDPICVPYNPIIIKSVKGSNGRIEYFEVVDENGNIYFFKDKDKTSPVHGFENCSWFLSEIISADRSESIKFYYSKGDSFDEYNWSSMLEVGCSDKYGSCSPDYNFIPDMGTVHNETILLDSITCNTTIVHLNYEQCTLDCVRNFRLSSIDILAKATRETVKKIILNHSSFGSGNGKRLRLDNLSILGNISSKQNYSFKYNSLHLPSYPTYFDYWGYYNGQGAIPGITEGIAKLIPRELMSELPSSIINAYGGYRHPHPYSMQACMLNEIHYPTGGKTIFEFEPNKTDDSFYPYSHAYNTIAGGLRIKKVTSYTDASTPAFVKSYEYGGGSVYYFSRKNFRYEKTFSFNLCEFNEWSGFNLYTTWERPYIYYSSSPIHSLTSVIGSPIEYNSVVEYIGTPDNNVGKTEYEYEWDRPVFFEDVPENWTTYHYDRGNNQPRLLRRFEYQYENGIYKKVRSLVNNYTYKKTNIFNTGVQLYHRKNWVALGCNEALRPYNNIDDYLNDFVFDDTKAYENIPMLSESIISIFTDDNKSITDITSYAYNSYTQLSKKTVTNSEGKLVENKFRYPADINTGVYASMKNSNMLNYPIETTELVNAKVVGSKLTTYKSSSGGYVPDKVYTLETASPLSSFTAFNGSTKDSHYNSSNPEIKFEYYDSKGNPTQITNREGITTSYLWDNTGQYPMAKVEGATYSEVSSLNGKICSYNSSTLYNSLKSKVPGAMISTYSYKPLIGLAQQTDPKGTSTYYDYDAFGRLKNVRDDDEYITSRNYYHYYNQTTSDGEGDPGQPDPYFSVSPSIMRFGAYGGTQSFTIESNTDWTVTHSPGWVTLSKTSGSGNATIVVTCPSYSSPRSDGITIQSTYEGTHFSTGGLGVLQNR